MTMLKKLLICCVTLFGALNASLAQTATLTGKITSANGESIPGASVLVLSTNLGSSADPSGTYKITGVPTGKTVSVRISGIGYKDASASVTLASGETRTLNIELDEGTKFLDEVIVTGLSINTKQKEMGTSRANINASTIESLPAPSVENALVGRLAGVEAYSTDGSPGGGFRFRIRGGNSISGTSEPLVIIDGIFMDNANRNTTSGAGGGNSATGAATFGMQGGTRGLGALNPEDIESMEILKGAAAASLYGSRAAAGVIVVKTKSGGGGKLKIDYSLDVGTTELARNVRSYKTQWTATEIDTWAALINPTKTIYTDANLAQYKINPITDYPTESFRQGSFQRNTVRLQGGTKKFGYYFSGNVQNSVGHIKGTDFKTKGGLLSLSSEPISGLSIKINVNYQDADRNTVASGSPGFFVPNRWANDVGIMPFMRLTDAKATLQGITNLDDYATIRRENSSTRWVASGNINYKILSNLSIDVTAGIDKSKINGNMIYPFGLVAIFPTGRLDRDYEELTSKTLTVGLNHAWKISEQVYLKSAAGSQYDDNERFYDYTRFQGLTAGRDFRDTSAYTAPQRPTFFQVQPIVRTLGLYFNETLGIKDKLFINIGGRRDQSTAFSNDAFYYFRSSLSYQVMDEFRLRASYGQSGTQPAAYGATPTFRTVAGGYNGSGSSYVPNTPPNPGLSPEQQDEFEAGFDANLANGRLRVEMSYYNKMFTNLLLTSPVNPALNLGLVSGIRNVGSMYNRGLELSVSADIIQTKEMSWNVTLTGSTLDNKVTRMPQPPTPIPGGIDNIVQIREGYPVSGIWAGVPFSAAPDAPGVAAPGSTAVRVFMGNTQPKFEGNINTTFQYGGLTLSALVGGKGGFFKYNQTARDLANPTKRQHAEFWDTPTAQLTSIYNDQTRWVQRADFIKLRQLNIAYNVPSSMLKNTKFIKRLNVGLTGANLAQWTTYSGGYDVEAETSGSGLTSAWARGIDSWDGGMPRSYTLSVNIGF